MYRMIDGHCVSRIRTYRTVRACNELPQRMEQHREQHALYIYIYGRTSDDGREADQYVRDQFISNLTKLPDLERMTSRIDAGTNKRSVELHASPWYRSWPIQRKGLAFTYQDSGEAPWTTIACKISARMPYS